MYKKLKYIVVSFMTFYSLTSFSTTSKGSISHSTLKQRMVAEELLVKLGYYNALNARIYVESLDDSDVSALATELTELAPELSIALFAIGGGSSAAN